MDDSHYFSRKNLYSQICCPRSIQATPQWSFHFGLWSPRPFVVASWHLAKVGPTFLPFKKGHEAMTNCRDSLPKSLRSLRAAARSTGAADACIMHAKDRVVVSKIWIARYCANPWRIVHIQLLATVGWKWSCQPFSCRCSLNVTHCGKEISSTRLSKESIPAKFPLFFLARTFNSWRDQRVSKGE